MSQILLPTTIEDAIVLIALIFALLSAITGIIVIVGAMTGRSIGSYVPRSKSDEQSDELKKQTDLMQRERQEKWSRTDYFK